MSASEVKKLTTAPDTLREHPSHESVLGSTLSPEVHTLRAESDGSSPFGVERHEDIYIGHGTSFEGEFKTTGTIFLDGALTKATVTAERLSIGSTGYFQGQAEIGRAEIAGRFHGVMRSAKDLIIRSSAGVFGDVCCESIVIHGGARIVAKIESTADQPVGERKVQSPVWKRAGFYRFLPHRLPQWLAPMMIGVGCTIGLFGTVILVRFYAILLPL